jgi:hypothetical protein
MLAPCALISMTIAKASPVPPPRTPLPRQKRSKAFGVIGDNLVNISRALAKLPAPSTFPSPNYHTPHQLTTGGMPW